MYFGGIRLRVVIICAAFYGIVQAQSIPVVVPQELSFAAPTRSGTPLTGTIGVTTRSGPNVPYTATARYLGPVDGWLSVAPATGMTPATLTVTVDPSRLAAGTYLGQIAVSAASIGRVVNVLLTVGAPGTAGPLRVNQTSLTFLGQQGTEILPNQSIEVTAANTSGSPVPFRVSASSVGWLLVSPLPETTPATIIVTAVQSGLPAGSYGGTVSLIPLSGEAPTIIPVTLVSTGSSVVGDTIQLGQTSLTITHQLGTAEPPAQFVGITTTAGFREYTATVSRDWLRLTSTFEPTPSASVTDYAPGSFNVQVIPTGLVPGTYASTVQVSSLGMPTVELPVQLNVTTTPALNVQPSSISLDDLYTTEATVIVTSTGNSALTFVASVPQGSEWLVVTPTAGSTASGAQILTVRANTSGLTAGVHTGRIVLQAQNGSTFTVPVRINISYATAVGALLYSPESVSLTAVSGGSNPSQIIEIRPETPGSQNFTASATSTGGWLQVDPFAGSVPGRVTVTANLQAAPGFGMHTGAVILTSLATGQQYTIPVTLDYAGDGIVAEPSTVTFLQPAVGIAPPEQTVQITAKIPSTWRVAGKPDWITVNPQQGNTPGTLTLWADIALMPPGSNTGVVRIAGPRNTVSLPVSVQVSPTSTSETIALSYALGAPEPPKHTIQVSTGVNAGTFSVTVTTESGIKWLTASPASGSTPAAVTVSIDPSMVRTGQHTGTVTVTTNNGSSETRTYPVTLTVTAPLASIQSVVHAATLNPTAVSPGQLITLTGVGLGPDAGVVGRPSAAGAYETRLGDTRVLFDGNPAPILFLRQDQINAIVPYSVYGRVSTRINVEQAGNWSLPIEAKVVDAAPGIFTATGTARGQAAAVNPDLTMNSNVNPVPRGGIITIFGTGEGQTDPAGQDGRIIATDLRRPLLPVTATIGGRPADVLYAGSAPTQVSGLFQVNLRVPEDIEPGPASVTVTVGGTASQNGVTIMVR